MTPTAKDRKRWYTALVAYAQLEGLDESDDEPGIAQDNWGGDQPPLTADNCSRYLIIQRDESDYSRYTLFDGDTIADVESTLEDILTEEYWYVAQVLDLETGRELSYRVGVTVTNP